MDIHPIVKKFIKDARDFGLEIASMDADFDALAEADPFLHHLVLEMLEYQSCIIDHLWDKYETDILEDDPVDESCDEEEEEGEEWKEQ